MTLQYLHNVRAARGAKFTQPPTITVFGKAIYGQASLARYAQADTSEINVLVMEWVASTATRVWTIRISQQRPNDESDFLATGGFIQSLGMVDISSPNPDTATTAGPAHSPNKSTSTLSLQLTAWPQVGTTPDWWSGACDVNNHSGSQAMATASNGLVACGPGTYNGGYDVAECMGGWGSGGSCPSGAQEYEWQCVELTSRWLFQAYGQGPYQANGNQFVSNYPGSRLTRVNNGTANKGPMPGDVVSFNLLAPNGHAAVVYQSTLDSNGTGTVDLIEQNANGDGLRHDVITAWTLADGLSPLGWLHDTWTSRIDVTARGADGQLYQKYWSESGDNFCPTCAALPVTPPTGVTQFVSDPASTWRLNNSQFDVFAEGNDSPSNMWHHWYTATGSGWGSLGPYPLGAVGSDTPAVAAPANGARMDLFVIRGGQLYWKHYSGSGSDCWVGCSWLTTVPQSPVPLLSHPAAVYFTQGTTDILEVYVQGNDYQNYAIWTQDGGTTWSSWLNLGGYPHPLNQYVAGPAVAAWPDGSRIDEIVTAYDDGFEYDKYYTSLWSAWSAISGQPTLAVSDPGIGWWPFRGLRRIDLYIQGADGHLEGRYWKSDTTSGWVDLGPWPGGLKSGNAPAVGVWR